MQDKTEEFLQRLSHQLQDLTHLVLDCLTSESPTTIYGTTSLIFDTDLGHEQMGMNKSSIPSIGRSQVTTPPPPYNQFIFVVAI